MRRKEEEAKRRKRQCGGRSDQEEGATRKECLFYPSINEKNEAGYTAMSRS